MTFKNTTCSQAYSKNRDQGQVAGGSDGKSAFLQCRRPGFDPWVGKITWRRKWQPTPVFLPGKFLGQRNMVGYSPWGCKESDTTEQLHSLHFLFAMPCGMQDLSSPSRD